MNAAPTEVFALSVTVQVPVPLQAPDHPLNDESESEAALSETEVPALNEAEHVPGQVMPLGVLIIEPLPVPDVTTVSVSGWLLLFPLPELLLVGPELHPTPSSVITARSSDLHSGLLTYTFFI